MTPSSAGSKNRIAIVLGAAVWAGGTPSPTLERRARYAISLYRAGRVSAILGCGGLGHHAPTEAEVIASLCRESGVPETAILQDNESTTTRENLLNAKRILCDRPASAVIVTDAYHAPRARLIARQIGLDATTDCPPLRAIGPRQWLRNLPREGLALVATVLRLR